MSDTQHLPCPFCGSSRIVKGERYFAMCVDCGATGPERAGDKGGVAKAMKDWNSRTDALGPTASREEVNTLRDALAAERVRNRELREELRRLIAQCDETDWMGPAGKMDAALDDARTLLDAAREGGE